MGCAAVSQASRGTSETANGTYNGYDKSEGHPIAVACRGG